MIGLPFRLERLGLLEQRLRARRLARLVQGIGQGGAVDRCAGRRPRSGRHGRRSPRPSPPPRRHHRASDAARRDCWRRSRRSSSPLRESSLQRHPHRRHRLPQPPERAEIVGGLVQDERLIASVSVATGLSQGGSNRPASAARSAPNAPSFLLAVELVAARDPRPIDLVQRLLMPPRLAAVMHRLEQRRHLGEGVGQRLGAVASDARTAARAPPATPPVFPSSAAPRNAPAPTDARRSRRARGGLRARLDRGHATVRAYVSMPASDSFAQLLGQSGDRRRS